MSMEDGVSLRVRNWAQEIANERKEWPMDGGGGYDEAEV